MATVIVDGIEVTIGDKERLNGIQAAERVGIEIPHYCWHAGLSVVASCRMCLVESGKRDPATGQITMLPKVVPACQTPAPDGTVFVTNSQKVRDARAMVEEDLLLRHPVDCPICDKAGECRLQDYHFEHGRDERRADIKPFHSRRRHLGDTVTLFVDRCVMCTRCVRFCREVSGNAELMVINRGAHEEIDVFPGFPLDNKMSGNVVDLCPVGALGDRDFLYQQRVWFMKTHDHVCAGCSTGCSIRVDENQDRVYRLKPRENPQINKWWMCDEGRYGWKHVHDENRKIGTRVLRGADYANIESGELGAELDRVLRSGAPISGGPMSGAQPAAGGRIAGVVSPHLTVEEAYLFCQYLKSVDPDALLVLGPIPTAGDDESFSNGFTIRAEKCPNRRGVEKVLGHFAGPLVSWDAFLEMAATEALRAVWFTGGYKTDWNSPEIAAVFARVPLRIVQDLFGSPLWDQAQIQIPAAAFVEREGSYVNHSDHLQSFRWAVRPPAGVTTEGRLLWQLLGKSGLYHAPSVMEEVGREIGYFAPALGGVPETGLDLRIAQIAVPT